MDKLSKFLTTKLVDTFQVIIPFVFVFLCHFHHKYLLNDIYSIFVGGFFLPKIPLSETGVSSRQISSLSVPYSVGNLS